MSKPKILVQLDSDRQPSVFDSVVAIDAGCDHLLRHGDVRPEGVRDLVYGAMFTRGVDDLKSTALFIGGSDVAAGEALLKQVEKTFFGPMRVSVMLDSNGANTTASAAVVCAARHVPLAGVRAVVLAGTGPVGSRVAMLLALEGAQVTVASRSREKAAAVCERLAARELKGTLTPAETPSSDAAAALLAEAEIVIAAGAPGVELATAEARRNSNSLKLAIDLSAVPPVGLAGIEVTDRATERDGILCYGAIGVGGTKMKIHKAAIRKLFAANDLVLDAEQIYRIGQTLDE
jgi:hypothetical protein